MGGPLGAAAGGVPLGVLGAPGTILADRYRLGEELGRGGMGAVYRATDLRTGGPVAVKALHPAFARDPVYRERLRREAQPRPC